MCPEIIGQYGTLVHTTTCTVFSPPPLLPSCSDEDDTAELLKELQKIRKERQEEQETKARDYT